MSTNSEEVHLNSVLALARKHFFVVDEDIHGPSSSEYVCYIFTVYFYSVVFSVDSITS